MDPPNLKSFLKLQEEALRSFLQKSHPLEDVTGLLDQHTEKVINIAERYSSKSLTSDTASVAGTSLTAFGDDTISISSIRFPGSNAMPNSAASVGGRGFSASSVPLDNFAMDSRSITSSVSETMLGYDSPILRDLTNVARSGRSPMTTPNGQEKSWAVKTELGEENPNRPSYATPDARREELRRVGETLSQEVQNEQTPSKKRKVSRNEVKHKSMFISESDSSEEEFWMYETGDRSEELDARRIIQEPKVKKAGQARRKSTTTASDAEEMKIRLDFGAWEQDEMIRKRGIGALDPIKMYEDVRALIASDGDEDEDSSHTASQVTLMILSLGSTQAIVDLKDIIKDMRCISQTKVVRPPVNVSKDLPKAVELAQWVFNSTNDGTSLENFQSRYCISNFCHYLIGRRDDMMRKNPGMMAKVAERKIYAGLMARVCPQIQRFENAWTGAKKNETPEFKSAVLELKSKSKRGFRWLALRKKFGIGIMALYYHSKLFSETAHVSIDDRDVSQQEFNLMMKYLSEDGSAHSAWLHRLCDLIKAHIRQGAKEILVLPELFLERWGVKQIMACQEQSDWLAMMCETLEFRLSCSGNKVSEAAWFRVDRKTIHAIWQKEVEKEVHKGVQEEAQL